MSSDKSVRKRTRSVTLQTDLEVLQNLEYKRRCGPKQDQHTEPYMTLTTGNRLAENTPSGTSEAVEHRKPLTEDDPNRSIKLAKKEEDMQLLLGEVKSLAQNLNPETHDMRRKLLDPAINALFVLMKKELGKKEAKIKQLTEELEAVNFTPSSLTGKRLLAKCRSLQHENEELGKRLCQGRVAQYELEIAMQKKLIDELKGNIKESDQLIVNLDDEVETLQSRVFNLQAHVDFCEKNHPPITSLDPPTPEKLNESE